MQQAMASYPKALLEAMNYTDLASATGYVGSAVFGMLGAAPRGAVGGVAEVPAPWVDGR